MPANRAYISSFYWTAAYPADFSLLPLGLILFVILSAPLSAGAFLGALLRHWRSQPTA